MPGNLRYHRVCPMRGPKNQRLIYSRVTNGVRAGLNRRWVTAKLDDCDKDGNPWRGRPKDATGKSIFDCSSRKHSNKRELGLDLRGLQNPKTSGSGWSTAQSIVQTYIHMYIYICTNMWMAGGWSVKLWRLISISVCDTQPDCFAVYLCITCRKCTRHIKWHYYCMLIALCSLFVFHFPRCNHFPRHR